MNNKSNHIQASNNPGSGWCSEAIEPGDFFFHDSEAAIINGHTRGLIEPCRQCIIKIISCLNAGVQA